MEFNGINPYDPVIVDAGYEENSQIYEDPGGSYPIPDHFGDGEYNETQTILADGSDRFGVSSVVFDHQEELLWMGNQGGHVTSYYSPALQKYTSFQVNGAEEVRDIHTFEEGILALTKSSLRCQMRRGIPIYTHTSANLVEMQCFIQVSPTNILMGGHQPHLINFDFNTGQEAQLLQVGDNGCAILRLHNRFICAGDPFGNITLLDPITLRAEHNLETHSGSLSDFDIHGNLLVTCGFSQRQGNLTVDRFLMVYDFRMMRAISPIPLVVDPLLLKFLPSFSSRLAVVSALGQMQLVDTVALNESELCLYQINTANSPLTMDVSPSCQYLSIGDAGGQIHLFSSSAPNASFNSFSRDTEFADPVETLPSISFDDYEVSLSTVEMPFISSDAKLASDWPEEFLKKVYWNTPSIDPEILKSMKIQGTIGYAPNPMTTKRNQIPYNMDKRNNSKNKNFNNGDTPSRGGSQDPVAIPKRYRKLELKHNNKEEFDFEPYNKTKFCGLEANLPNNYCNVMLEILYFLEPIRCMALGHLCSKEFCLCCELSFLFNMLDNSQKVPCQASNFLRAFRTVPEASALGLILSDQNPDSKKKTNLIRLIQSWNRFILHQLHFENLETRKRKLSEMERRRNASESPRGRGNYFINNGEFTSVVEHSSDEWYRHLRGKSQIITNEGNPIMAAGLEGSSNKDDETEVSRLFGMKQLQINRCLKCDTDINKESTLLLCNLVYLKDGGVKEQSFCQVLSKSLCPGQTTPAWCDKCNKFRPTLQLKRLESLPHVLALNCGMDNQNDKDFWQNQMDFLIGNVNKLVESPGKSGNNSGSNGENGKSPNSTVKLCRYGENCNRSNCRFRHPGQEIDKTVCSNSSQLYYTHPWLPTHIQIDLDDTGNVEIKKLTDSDLEKPHDVGELKQSIRYDLMGVVCHITENDEKKNLVAFVNVGRRHHERVGAELETQWYLFNNISVTLVPEQEVTWFNLDWKVPCVLYWINRDLPPQFYPTNIPNPITVDVFGEDKCIARDRGRKRITFMPLGIDEFPKKGELVAMDAEFVTLNQEEAELRSDGKLSTVKPSHMSVARITCIRGLRSSASRMRIQTLVCHHYVQPQSTTSMWCGLPNEILLLGPPRYPVLRQPRPVPNNLQGMLEGTPFIDDYISTQEQVYDYLTKFSGIQPGDLDANFSSKHLTTLKSTYLKLRFLVDIGVKFVGHGLKNDFRVINILVPPEQIIDTVSLFHLPHQRMISLRFLAWHFLGVKIQSVTHDSIEDARAALQLYFHYLKLEEQGIVQESLEKLYELGQSVQWTVPDDGENTLQWEPSDEEV